MRRFGTPLSLVACVLLALSGCTRLVTAPTADPAAGTLVAYVVVSSGDSGPGTLRQVVADAPAGAIVTFDPAITLVTLGSGPITIDEDLTIAGPTGGTVTISGNDVTTVFKVAPGGVHAVLQNLTITRGRGTWGGGIQFDWWTTGYRSKLTLLDCTVAENVATEDGGGLFVHGDFHMERTTVRDNTANAFGGGVYFYSSPLPVDAPTGTIVDSTFTGNEAQQGGGVHNAQGWLAIAFSTIGGNRTTLGYGGGLASVNDHIVQTSLRGTIVIGNTSTSDGSVNDVYALHGTVPFDSNGYNLVGVGSGAANLAADFTEPGDVIGLTSVGLLALADNGGPTWTRGLATGSRAIDAVPPAACTDVAGAAVSVDQRGVTRPQGTNCDIGAFEVVAAAGTVVTSGSDSGAGSLRQVVLDAEAGATVTFAEAVSEVTLTSGTLVIDKSLTIAGPEGGTVTIRGNGVTSVIKVSVANVDVTLQDLTITGGSSSVGGGIRMDWPGDWTDTPPSLRLVRCTVVGNHASSEGGGVFATGDLHLESTTVTGNTAVWGAGISYFGPDVTDSNQTAATIVNSTISGNTASSEGGGVMNYNGAVRILFSTVTGNSAGAGGGGGVFSFNDDRTRTTLKATVVVGNTGESGPDDVYGRGSDNRFVSLGANVIGATSGTVDVAVEFAEVGDLTGVTVAAAGLGALADNGGTTLTHALSATSPARDRVSAGACTDMTGASLDSDQRGVTRPQGATCDAGAFELEGATTVLLYVTVSPEGSGTVTGAGAYAIGDAATLTATPSTHWQFSGWSGDLSGSANPATVTMDAAKDVVATFTPVLYTVTATIDGGGGSVVHDPTGTAYPYGTAVSVRAVPTAAWGFSHWTGDLTGPFNPGSLLVTGPMSYTAHFIRWYTVTTDVVGSGKITLDPPADSFPTNSTVTLTAVPDVGWHFTAWSGHLTGSTNPATVTMDADKVITATFAQDVAIGVDVTIQGSGQVTVLPEGPYAAGDVVTLTATPAAGWFFQTWSGALTGSTNPATLTLTAREAVTATFQRIVGPMLTVTLDGAGSVTSSPVGIDCGPSGGACTASFRKGTRVTLTALPDAGAGFLRWSGAASGSAPTATVRLTGDAAVTARFVELNGPIVSIDPTGTVRGSTAVVTGSLVCASGAQDLDVSIFQEVAGKGGVIQFVSASATLVGVPCGQLWRATLTTEFGRFVRGDATVTVRISGVPTAAMVSLR